MCLQRRHPAPRRGGCLLPWPGLPAHPSSASPPGGTSLPTQEGEGTAAQALGASNSRVVWFAPHLWGLSLSFFLLISVSRTPGPPRQAEVSPEKKHSGSGKGAPRTRTLSPGHGMAAGGKAGPRGRPGAHPPEPRATRVPALTAPVPTVIPAKDTGMPEVVSLSTACVPSGSRLSVAKTGVF